MITESEQKKLRALFQGHYADDVLRILNDRHILNRNGEPHNTQYIRMVFQGVRNNTDIEAAIWQLAANKTHKKELQKLQKQKIFNNKP